MTPTKPLMFELKYRKAAHTCPDETVIIATMPHGTFERTPEKDKDLPDVPKGFQPMTGAHRDVAKRAKELNDLQTKVGILFYFYFPEAVGPDVAPGHDPACVQCSSAKAKRELG